MKLTPSTHCTTREEWRNWLQNHHSSHTEVWLLYYKKHTGLQSVSYRESVEEALCFGWIDGLKRRVDDQRYTHRFTPRKANSKWSPLNIQLAEKLITEGKMTGAGLSAFENRIAYDEEFLEKRKQSVVPVPEEFKEALKNSRKAQAYFQSMAPGYRKQYLGWITAAKRAETRSKRITEAIRMLEQNKKPGMK